MKTNPDETLGTIELKIARLQHQLQVLAFQERMSRNYPEHHPYLRTALATARQTMADLAEMRRHLQMTHLSQIR